MLSKVKFRIYRNRIFYKWVWTLNLFYVKQYDTRDLILNGCSTNFYLVNFMTFIMGGII